MHVDVKVIPLVVKKIYQKTDERNQIIIMYKIIHLVHVTNYHVSLDVVFLFNC